tara:strand:- start:292 stop:456 length:165 start_codon:yes stop_codon:yes gene_type:complete
MNNFNYEFEITLPDGDSTYQYNNSPKLTEDFIDFLTEVDIDINNCIYKVTKITN